MIGTDEINAALEQLNPRHDAVNSVFESFGGAEAAPYVNDLLTNLEINVEAIRDFGRVQLAYYLEEGNSLELAAAKVEAIILGFNVGVLASRLERSNDLG